MPRSSPIPSYRLHKPSGQAVVTIRTADRGRRDIYLGVFDSSESRAEYGRLIAELATAPAAAVVSPAGPRSTVDQVVLAYLKHAATHYRSSGGKPTGEVREIKRAVVPLHTLYGHTAAADFGPLALATVRQQMIKADLCRKVINQRVDRLKRLFKWAASQELVPVAVYQALRTLGGLQKGRCEASESAPVKPVDPAHVSATLPFLGAHVRAMVELQLLTGMRPGEVCALRLADIDATGTVWFFRPRQHKTLHRGKERVPDRPEGTHGARRVRRRARSEAGFAGLQPGGVARGVGERGPGLLDSRLSTTKILPRHDFKMRWPCPATFSAAAALRRV